MLDGGGGAVGNRLAPRRPEQTSSTPHPSQGVTPRHHDAWEIKHGAAGFEVTDRRACGILFLRMRTFLKRRWQEGVMAAFVVAQILVFLLAYRTVPMVAGVQPLSAARRA